MQHHNHKYVINYEPSLLENNQSRLNELFKELCSLIRNTTLLDSAKLPLTFSFGGVFTDQSNYNLVITNRTCTLTWYSNTNSSSVCQSVCQSDFKGLATHVKTRMSNGFYHTEVTINNIEDIFKHVHEYLIKDKQFWDDEIRLKLPLDDVEKYIKQVKSSGNDTKCKQLLTSLYDRMKNEDDEDAKYELIMLISDLF